jgi:hypothetical protein
MSLKQRFSPYWLLFFLAIIGVQIQLSVSNNQPIEYGPMLAPILLGLLFLFLFYINVRINGEGIGFNLSPFFARQYNWETITQAEIISYKPLRNFGGWGWRYSPSLKVWAYTVSGSTALSLTFRDGKTIYIGIPAAKKAEVQEAITRYQPKR